MRNRTVVAYKNYFEDFLRKQTPKTQAKILQTLRIIEEINIISANYFKHIEGTDGLYEIRIVFGNNIFRVFCMFDDGRLVILMNGFQKKTAKTPVSEINRALRIMEEYKKEKNRENKI